MSLCGVAQVKAFRGAECTEQFWRFLSEFVRTAGMC